MKAKEKKKERKKKVTKIKIVSKELELFSFAPHIDANYLYPNAVPTPHRSMLIHNYPTW